MIPTNHHFRSESNRQALHYQFLFIEYVESQRVTHLPVCFNMSNILV